MKFIFFSLLCLYSFGAIAQTNSPSLMKQGEAAYVDKEYEMALDFYKKAYKSDKKNIEALFWRGMSKIQLGDLDGAIKDMGMVLKEMPTHYGALVNRGNLYSVQGEYVNALSDFSAAEAVNSDSISVYINRGHTYFLMKKFDLAIADFTKAIKINPSYILSYHNRSECYNYIGNIEGAMVDLEKIIELDSTDKISKINLAFCYISTKQYEKAALAYEKLYQSDKRNPYILNNYGYVKHILGDTKKGLDFIFESLRILPSNAYPYKYLAEIYKQQNEIEKACEAVVTGLKLGFTNSYGNDLLDFQKSNCK